MHGYLRSLSLGGNGPIKEKNSNRRKESVTINAVAIDKIKALRGDKKVARWERASRKEKMLIMPVCAVARVVLATSGP
ncbi:hypothetical protein GCM10011352_04470 [Marinobacterium zhoushanense]|uniref:Uncharacterized protein n=1 Tax=Marinobacterium zhoushanense TaxID=1679163 RepID=A0ABQ1JY56_9GAMM|nr:hypothetical protein GCM10011352_04470 [Marinobacterium zhoushanense]